MTTNRKPRNIVVAFSASVNAIVCIRLVFLLIFLGDYILLLQ